MKRLYGDGVCQFTVTGCDQSIAKINLSVIKPVVKKCIEFVVTADHTEKHKPYPDPYNLAFEEAAILIGHRCGNKIVSASDIEANSVIVEDSGTGMKAGLRTKAPAVIQFIKEGQPAFDAEKEGFDPSRVLIAKSAQEIYFHVMHVQEKLGVVACRFPRAGLKGKRIGLKLRYLFL